MDNKIKTDDYFKAINIAKFIQRTILKKYYAKLLIFDIVFIILLIGPMTQQIMRVLNEE